jgi:nucleotide-binding universal stress UspA family protein
MIRRLLVPLDGSRLAESVLPASAALARIFGAGVLLLHVVEKSGPRSVHGQRHLSGAAEAEGYLRGAAERFFPAGLAVETHVHEEAVTDPAAGIAEHEGEFAFDLVVMSVHGRGRAARLVAVGMAQEVLARGSRPVLLLHAEDPRVDQRFPCRSVLLPVDPEEAHAASFALSLEFARGLSAPVHLILVVPTFATLPPRRAASGRLLPRTADALLDMSAEQARSILDGRRRRAESLGLETSTDVLRGDPARAIVKAAGLLDADLVMLGTHGRSGMQAFWAGSVAHGVYSRCLLPLLLIPEERTPG